MRWQVYAVLEGNMDGLQCNQEESGMRTAQTAVHHMQAG